MENTFNGVFFNFTINPGTDSEMNRNKIIIKVVAILIITLAGAITAYYYYKNLPEQEEVGEVKSQTEDEIGKELNGILAKEFIGMMEMVRIPAGEVMLGSGEFQRLINIEQPILMGKYEITQRQFTQLWGLHKFSNIDMDKPADNISWHDANEFCQRLSKVTGETYRLPTEAEWTRAYTAGKHTQYPGETRRRDGLTTHGLTMMATHALAKLA